MNRKCGSCMLCCKLPRIEDLKKPQNIWCQHAKTQIGCTIYAERPMPCRDFHCFWLDYESFGDEWKPDKAGFFLYGQQGSIILLVDPGRPRAYESPKYLMRLRIMAQEILDLGGRFIVANGNKGKLLLPDREIPLGNLDEIERIDVRSFFSASGLDFEVKLIRK
jgi:hypothetical protein